MQHQEVVKHYTSNRQLARAVADLRYDSLAQFLEELSSAIEEDSAKDLARQRPLLALQLYKLSGLLKGAVAITENIWSLCKDKMETPFTNHDNNIL